MKISLSRDTRHERDTKQASKQATSNKKQQEPIDEGTKNSTSLPEQVPDQAAWRTSHTYAQTIQDPLLDDTRYLLALPIGMRREISGSDAKTQKPKTKTFNQSIEMKT